MKTIKKLSLAFMAFLMITLSYAQNYKAPKIDASGKITDGSGKHIGNVTKEGVVTDAMGMKVATMDATGSLVETKTGKKLGKAEKNGNFVSAFAKTPDEGWSVSAPENGTCYVKDKSGKVMAEVHESYKQVGACAIHCLTAHMDHDKMSDEKLAGSYVCPMDKDVVSDKPGKCSKCGMALVKKTK